MLEIITRVLGPLQTNTVLLADPTTFEAAVIDPAWDGPGILAEAQRLGWRIGHIWYTHAHFDHIGGAAGVADGLKTPPVVALHPADYPLWRASGGAPLFGLEIDPGPEPSFDLAHGQTLRLGSGVIEVRHCPGHTRGHVIFYCPAEAVALVGDTIFQGSIGRTDLPGGDHDTLIQSIHAQILSLPNETRLISGHGSLTTVRHERATNPYILAEI
jgi:glyoxylase-like metal-dependent hydrolase (beta-lactamase superfamily II)